ncbi:hypothetical protein ACQP1P_27985 [Dactylosporangium sp. CA-052675]|uniref:hypothetical protein n=1 Tax=Dactylosporangium sp. CA-052675 TaxID=3239927 RepID=UPI003D948D97
MIALSVGGTVAGDDTEPGDLLVPFPGRAAHDALAAIDGAARLDELAAALLTRQRRARAPARDAAGVDAGRLRRARLHPVPGYGFIVEIRHRQREELR